MVRILVPLLLILAALAGCGGGGSSSTDAAASTKSASVAAVGAAGVGPVNVTVASVTKVSEARVGRTVFDYAFRITVQNGRDALTSVQVVLTAVGTGSTIVKGTVTAGDLEANASAQPTETIVIRHDRAVPFDQAAMKWAATGTVIATPPPLPPTIGVLLTGDPAADAAQAVRDYDVERLPFDTEYVTDPLTGGQYQRTQISATLRQGATVGAVNAALQAAGARVVFMRQGGMALTLQVPDPGGLAALVGLATTLTVSGAFDTAGPVFSIGPARLPSKLTAADAQARCTAAIHLAAANLPAAWNAVRPNFSSLDVELIIADFFAAGTTTDGLDCGPEVVASHGWHVEGILAADHGGLSKVTGAVAIPLKINRINLSAIPAKYGDNPLDFMQDELRAIFAAAPTKKFAFNLSVGYKNPAALAQGTAERDAKRWKLGVGYAALALLNGGYERQVVQVSAAGNDKAIAASDTSPWNRAVLGPMSGAVPIQNGIVVENRRVIPGTATSGPRADCLHDTSSRGGTIGAVGTDVLSWISSTQTGHMTGTSMASPQVAGTAAIMLSIAPRRVVRDVIDALLNNAVDDGCPNAKPMLDAYASVLAMDETLGLDSGEIQSLPSRLTMLHPSGAGLFTVADFSAFVDALFTPNVAPNYTSFDLNGDGIVGDGGGAKEARFNLDIDTVGALTPMQSQYSSPPRAAMIGGPSLNKASGAPLDERHATDFEILCYYAGSKLFAGTAADVASVLTAKSTLIGKPISCARFTDAVLKVDTTNPGWTGLPATIEMTGLQQMTIPLFQLLGDPGNTCGSGERGGPIFSASVDPTALFFSVTTVTGLPLNFGGAGINRRPCSSFVARNTYPPLIQERVWINATGRGQTFGGTSFDWEIQVRYTNGDPRAQFAGAQCKVGVVPNSGNFVSSFDATCTHQLSVTKIVQ